MGNSHLPILILIMILKNLEKSRVKDLPLQELKAAGINILPPTRNRDRDGMIVETEGTLMTDGIAMELIEGLQPLLIENLIELHPENMVLPAGMTTMLLHRVGILMVRLGRAVLETEIIMTTPSQEMAKIIILRPQRQLPETMIIIMDPIAVLIEMLLRYLVLDLIRKDIQDLPRIPTEAPHQLNLQDNSHLIPLLPRPKCPKLQWCLMGLFLSLEFLN